MTTSFECHGTIFRSLGEVPQMKLFINDVPGSKLATRLETITKQS